MKTAIHNKKKKNFVKYKMIIAACLLVGAVGFSPAWAEESMENLVYPVVPVLGPYCGFDDVKPIAWIVADKWQFLGGMVSFVDACKTHDRDYEDCSGPNGTHANSKEFYDAKFGNHIKGECHQKLSGWRKKSDRKICLEIADAYYEAVKNGGQRSYDKYCNR